MRTLISAAEAAFIAQLTDRQMHRMVDEHLAPKALVSQDGSTRLFTRLCAAFAKFYFDTEDVLQATVRRWILQELSERVQAQPDKDAVLALARTPEKMNWHLDIRGISVDVSPFIFMAYARAKEVDHAEALVHTDHEILGGTPVFSGTRLPIESVLGALDAGDSLQELQKAYPYLTEAHVDAARVYEIVHPRRGRPRRLQELHPDLAVKRRRVLRPAQA